MMKIFAYSCFFLLISLSVKCEKDKLDSTIPGCVKDKIDNLKKEDCPSVGQVLRYQFQGQTVYVIHPKNCGADFTSEVVDQDCNTMCHLGGIIGNTDCEGVNFMAHATDEKQVYP